MKLNIKVKKLTACTLAAMLSVSMLAGCSANDDSGNNDKNNPSSSDNSKTENSIKAEGEGYAYKEETVYVTTAPDGSVEKIIVSDWLKNSEYYATLKDVTNLSDIVNVKGDEAFNVSDGKISFDANGNDIYYQGQLDKSASLPVSMKITYTLDGKEISAKEIHGKSGKLTMTIEYTANEKTDSDVYIPFLAATGILLPTDTFTNVEVTNGKIISNGDYNILIGMAVPGISETLGIELPNTVTIAADVTDYNIDVMMTVCTNKFFNDLSTDDLSQINDLSDMISLLSESSTKLVNGAKALNDGLKELQSNTASLIEGVSKLNNGASSLSSGLKDLNAGASSVNDGVKQLSASMNTMLATIKQSIADNNAQIAAAKTTIQTLTSKIGELQNQISQVEAAVNAGLKTADEGAVLKKQLSDGISQCQTGIETATAGINQLSGANAALEKILSELTAKDSNGNDLATNLTILANGTQSLTDGSKKLSDGAVELAAGLGELNKKIPVLIEGINKLTDGSSELNAGMNQFNESAIQKIAELYENDFSSALDDIKDALNASKEYKTLTGISDEADGSVTFIIKTN